jgi:hypothetical protein
MAWVLVARLNLHISTAHLSLLLVAPCHYCAGGLAFAAKLVQAAVSISSGLYDMYQAALLWLSCQAPPPPPPPPVPPPPPEPTPTPTPAPTPTPTPTPTPEPTPEPAPETPSEHCFCTPAPPEDVLLLWPCCRLIQSDSCHESLVLYQEYHYCCCKNYF